MKNSFLKNIGIIFSGNALAQVIPYLLSPVLSRIFSPNEFGVFSNYLAGAALISIIASGGLEYSLVLPKKGHEAKNLFFAAFLLNVCVFFLSIFVFLMLKFPTKSVYYLVPLSAFFLAGQRILSYWQNRNKNYKQIAKAAVVRSAVSAPSQIGFSFLKLASFSLILGDILGQLLKFWLLLKSLKISRQDFNFKQIKASLANYRQFPKFAMPSELFNHFSIQLPILLLIPFFGASAAGLYFLPQKLMSAPLNLLGNAISQVFFKDAADIRHHPQMLTRFSTDLFRKLFSFGIVPFSIILFFGKEIFSFVFGVKWLQAGIFAQMISPWLFLVFVFSPLSSLFMVKNELKLSLKLNILLFTLRLGSLLFGTYFFKDINSTILLYAVSSFIYWLFLGFYIFKLAGIPIRSILFFMAKLTIATELILWALKWWSS